MKVYITNESGHNFDKALKCLFKDTAFEIVYITHGTVHVFSTERVLDELKKKLLDYNPALDYIVLSGSSFINVMVSMLAINSTKQHVKNRVINLLVYNSKTKKYIPREFSIDTLKGDITLP